MSAPTRSPRKPTDDPLFAVIEPTLKVGAFAGKLDPVSPGKCYQRALEVTFDHEKALVIGTNKTIKISVKTPYALWSLPFSSIKTDTDFISQVALDSSLVARPAFSKVLPRSSSPSRRPYNAPLSEQLSRLREASFFKHGTLAT